MPQASVRKQRGKSLKKLIDDLFGLDPRIRFIAIYQGQYIIAGGMKPNLDSYDPVDEARDIDLQLEKIGEMVRKWQRWFGRLSSVTLMYEKINLIFQPLQEELFLVLSSEVDFDPEDALARLRAHPGYLALTEGTQN